MWKPGNQGGRPTVGPKVETRLPADELRKVDDFAATHDFSRAEALRQLVRDGLLLASADRKRIPEGAVTTEKIAPDAIKVKEVDPQDPLFVHTTIRLALRKVGMSEAEANRYATAHQKNAVDAYRTTEQ